MLLHLLLGLQRIGWPVLFLDRAVTAREAENERGMPADYVQNVLTQVAVPYAQIDTDGRAISGLGHQQVVDALRRSALLLNVMGFLDDPELLGEAQNRVFLDIDPGYGQMWRELGLADVFDNHDTFVTVGENVGRDSCSIPTCGLDWITTPPSAVLDEWPVHGGGRRFTSVATWRGPYGTLQYDGKTFGSRVHEFRKFAELPRLTDTELELALDIHPAEVDDLRLLDENGWCLVDPIEVAGDPWTYRSYVQQSRAELSVAQNMYVETHCGWLSDRSICYLASGKPVLAQDTGFSRNYPTGEGLLAFSTLDEAAAGVEEIEGSYLRHSKAARELAEEYFASDKVLGRLLERLGVA